MSYKILIIDDTQVIREFLKEVLTDKGFEVDTAENGLQGVEKAKQNDYAIIFCDVHMPAKNGLQTVREILDIKPDLPIVMTDSLPGQLAREAQTAGAISCLSKPFSLDELREILDNIIITKSEVKL